MAAAEYYHQTPAGSGPQPSGLPAARPPYITQQSPHLYPQMPPSSDQQPQQPPGPPPYQAVEMPAEKLDRPTEQRYQPLQQWSNPYSPVTPSYYHGHQPLQPGGWQQSPAQQYPQQPTQTPQPLQPAYPKPPPHLRPYHTNSSSPNLALEGYSSDPEPHRRRHSRKSNSRSTTADGFLGAAGGGLIGDMIFPGLGTIGGAVAGYFGGVDYGKHRKGRECRRHKERGRSESRHGKRGHSGDRRS